MAEVTFGEHCAWQGADAMKRVLLCVLMLLGGLANGAAAQVPGEIDLRLQHLGVEQGLSQSTARALAQDGDGMLWIGTQDGLNRYDGYTFHVFRHDAADNTSLPDNHVTALATDKAGRLWVGTQSGGLGRYDPEQQAFHNFPVALNRSDALAATPVNAILAMPDGELWVASGHGHLQRLNPTNERFTTIVLPTQSQVRTLLALPDGDVLIGTSQGLLRWVHSQQRIQAWAAQALSAGTADVQALAREGVHGNLWVGTASQGAFELTSDGAVLRQVSFDDGVAADDVRSLLVDARGRIWIGTYNGLSRIDAEGAAPHRWLGNESRSDGLVSGRVHALLQDRDGLIWIGTWLGGAHVYLPGSDTFREFRSDQQDPRGLPGNGVRSVLSNPDGSLWLGILGGGGLIHFSPDRGVLERFYTGGKGPLQLPSDRIQALARDLDGGLWVGFMDVGLAYRRPGTSKFELLPPRPGDAASPAAGNVLTMHVDRTGTLWVGYEDKGLDALCRGCDRFRHFTFDATARDSLPGQTIGVVFEDRAGRLWVGARPGGLSILDRVSGRTTPLADVLSAPTSNLPRAITMITQSRNGELWVGTQGGGLARLTPVQGGRFRLQTYTRKQGLAAEAIGRIFEDARGDIWASTTLGISRLDPASGFIQNFSSRAGAQGEGYFVESGAAMPDGRIAFGGLRGLTIFNPNAVFSSDAIHRPMLTDVRAYQSSNAKVTEWRYRKGSDHQPDSLWLRAGSGGFGFSFSALTYSDPELVEYSYRLEPLDSDWIKADANQRNAGYPHLSPGDYRLRLRARFPGESYGPERVVDVHLAALWWQTLWARLGAALLLLLPFGLWGWNRRKLFIERANTQAVLAESEERLKLALWGTGDEFWDADLVTGRLVRINPMPNIKGLGDVAQLSFSDLVAAVHPQDQAELTAALSRHINGSASDFDNTYRMLDVHDHWRWLRSRGRLVEYDAAGRPVRMAGVTVDVSELREHESAMERVNQELEQRVDQRTSDLTLLNHELSSTIDQLRMTQHQLVESEKLAALGGLVAGIAHEVNTPLGVGVTAASHLEQQAQQFRAAITAGAVSSQQVSAFSQTVSDASAMVLRNLQRADKMIRSFKQVAVDQTSEAPRMIQLAAYMDEILVSLQPVLKRSPHELEIDIPAGLAVYTQPGAIYQIVVNLVTNSLTHAFAGIAHGRMQIAAAADGDGWVLHYSDNGVGMQESVRRRIYDPFFTTRRGQGGSGLGMHIVYKLVVQTLEGSIECESELGKGTQFTLRFPHR